MRIIKIEEGKVDKLSAHEESLKASGQSDVMRRNHDEGGYGERDDDDDDDEMEGMRGGYRGGYGMRDYDGTV